METSGCYLFRNARIFTPQAEIESGWLLVQNGKIGSLGIGEPPEFKDFTIYQVFDAGGFNLLPGFIDLHVHGAMGMDVMDASPDGICGMAKYFSRHGVTSFLATTWSDPNEATLKVISNLAGLVGPIKGGARLLGVHLEGPYLNPQKAGAHEPGYIRIAETVEVEQFLETGIVKLVTLAPEIPENLRAVEKFVRRGITVSIGHSNATFEQVNTAFERGLSHATHTFNAMGGFGHREPGTVGAVMSIPGIKCELISDNIHVHPASQKVLFQVKGPEGVILVTDAARGTGLPDGDYLYGSRNVHIQSGAARLMDGTLAGSTLTMERALNNAIAASGWPLRDAWPMSSLNAARQVNISNRKGSIETGKDADIILLDADFNVILTMVEGRVAYSIMQDF